MGRDFFSDIYASETIPDGTYDGECVSVRLVRADECLLWDLKVDDGPYAGTVVHKWSNVSQERAIACFAREAKLLGVLFKSTPDFLNRYRELEGKRLRFWLNTDENGQRSCVIVAGLAARPAIRGSGSGNPWEGTLSC